MSGNKGIKRARELFTPNKYKESKRTNSKETPRKPSTNNVNKASTSRPISNTSGGATSTRNNDKPRSSNSTSDVNIEVSNPPPPTINNTPPSTNMEAISFLDQFKNAFIETMRDIEGKAAFTNIIQPIVEDNFGKLSKIVKQQQEKIDSLETEMESLKMKERSKTLIFTGIKEDRDICPMDQVIQLCKDKLKINIHPLDIDEAFRPKAKGQGQGAGNIIVTLTTKRKKIEIMRTKKILKNYSDGSTNVYINESLTPNKSELFAKTRNLVKRKKIISTWTRDGQIFVKKTVTDKPCLVESKNELDKLNQ